MHSVSKSTTETNLKFLEAKLREKRLVHLVITRQPTNKALSATRCSRLPLVKQLICRASKNYHWLMTFGAASEFCTRLCNLGRLELSLEQFRGRSNHASSLFDKRHTRLPFAMNEA
jgi:hypothetical protein